MSDKNIDYEKAFNSMIERLVVIQKHKAIERFGLYKNDQEFFGAIFEEYKEANKDMATLRYYFEKDMLIEEITANKEIDGCIEEIKEMSLNAIKELIQVVACCDKYNESNVANKEE